MTDLQATKIKEFKGTFSGGGSSSKHYSYESARKIWNAAIEKHAALIVRCTTTTSDVVHAVNFVRDSGLLLAVRGGGHNIAGNSMCDDGIVIDLSQRRAASVDRGARQAIFDASMPSRHCVIERIKTCRT